jgi:hypothetical protein
MSHYSETGAEWPRKLVQLRTQAIKALVGLRHTNVRRLSERERSEHEDQLRILKAMADLSTTASVYFAMASAMAKLAGRPLSDTKLVQAEQICRALGQEPLSTELWQAIERVARKRQARQAD